MFASLCSVVVNAQESTALLRGAEILMPFKQQLQQTLQTGLTAGPVAAIDACKLEAPAIALTSAPGGTSVGRSSHKLRNPANAPKPWMRLVMTAYINRPEQRQPVALRLENGRIGYVEPIILQPMCVACHGDALPAPVAERIRQLYPDDQATGFLPGDLRGVFWAEFAPSVVSE